MTGFVAFLGIAVLVIVTPGQDTALTIRNSLLGGRRGGILTALGGSTGQAFWTLAATAGIAALLVASEPVFAFVKLVGAAYLVFHGAQALVDACRSRAVLAPVALGLVFCTLTLVWLTAYALVVAKAGDVLRRPSIRRLVDCVTGTVLAAFGLRLASEER